MGDGERTVDLGQRAVRVQGLRLKLSEQPMIEPREDSRALIGIRRQRSLKRRCAGHGVMKATPLPTGLHFTQDAPVRHPVLSTKSFKGTQPRSAWRQRRRARCRVLTCNRVDEPSTARAQSRSSAE